MEQQSYEHLEAITKEILYHLLIEKGFNPVMLKKKIKMGIGDLTCQCSIYDFDSDDD